MVEVPQKAAAVAAVAVYILLMIMAVYLELLKTQIVELSQFKLELAELVETLEHPEELQLHLNVNLLQ